MEESARVNRFIIPFCVAIIILHAWAALQPSHYNWGFHQFAFYPVWVGSLVLLLSGVYLFARPRAAALEGLSHVVEKIASIPTPILFLLLGALFVLLAVVLEAKGLLLGDSYFLSQLTPGNPAAADASSNFRNQPLTYLLIRGIRYALGGGEAISVERTYQAVGIAAGLSFLVVLFVFLKDVSATALDRALIGGFLLFRVATEFFLGYVENYAFFYVGITAYLCCSWMVIEGRLHWSVPVLLLLTAAGLHLGSLVFLPSLVVLLLAKHRTVLVGTLAAIGFLGAGIIALSGGGFGYTFLLDRLRTAMLYDFLSLDSTSAAGAYPIFSSAHLVDWGNALIMSAPFAPLGLLFVLVFWKRLWASHRHLLLFLLTASGCGLFFTFVFNPGLGMARDWDIIAVFFLPTSFLTIFGLIAVLKGKQLRHALIILVLLRLLRTGAWFGINASEDDHIERAEMLTAPELSGPIRKYYYEAVADLYWKRADYDKARYWFELYMQNDSLNPRIAANLSSCYERVGDSARAEAMLARAAALGSTLPGVYSNLGLKLINRGELDSAIALLTKAVSLNPSFAFAHANLAEAYVRSGRMEPAADHAVRAYRLGLREPALLKTAGYAYAATGNDELALHYLELYLPSAPKDTRARELRDELATRLKHSGR